MSVKWTEEQEKVIQLRNRSLLVSAAAGSGKTAVLVQRIISMVMDEVHPLDIDRLLVVTFTNAAAAEMRERVGTAIEAALEKDPYNQHLQRQLTLVHNAQITTIDSFCIRILRDHFHKIDLEPGFRIADEGELKLLREDVCEAVLEEFYEKADPEFLRFADSYSQAKNDLQIKEMVLKLFHYSESYPWPEEWLESCVQQYEAADEEALEQKPWMQDFLSYMKVRVGDLIRALEHLLDLTRDADGPYMYEASVQDDLYQLYALQECEHFSQWQAAITGINFKNIGRAKKYEGSEQKKDAVKSGRDRIKDQIVKWKKTIFASPLETQLQRLNQTSGMVRMLVLVTQAFAKQFALEKQQKNMLDFSDVEHYALRVLVDPVTKELTETALEYQQQYQEVMIDEYQDSNYVQETLLTAVSGVKNGRENLFMVGDVKQSIYRFRLASPEIFIGKRGGFAPYTPGGPHPATVTLGHNFRSAGNIIDQINDVFACVMSRTVGDVDYNGDEMLVRGADDGYDGGPMELDIVDMSGGDTALGDAGAVADAVERLVKEGFAVREKGGGTRRCGYGDICVLLRSRARFGLYAAEFARRGIPSFADTGESPLTSTEVSPVLSLLRVIDNPGQDVHLAAALVSVMFSFTPDDLTRLRLLAPRGSLYAALLKSEEPKAQAFLETLRALRRLAATASVEELCGEIFARTHYFAAVGAMENGPARRETLRAFTAWAAGVDRGGAGGLAAFLRVVDSAVESGAVQSGGTPVLPEGAVSIMTIHRSKGLEFPVVILADTARRFNLRDTSNPVLFHPSLGLGMNLRADGDGGLYSTVPHRAVRMAQRSEAVSEEMRILYVALTRARDKLIVTAPLQNPEKTLSALATTLAGTGGAEPYTLSQALSFSEWLCTAALLHPDCEELRKYAGGALLPVYAARGHMRARVVPAQPAGQAADEPSAFVRTARPDAALLEQLLQNFGARYENAPLCTLPAKLSVSGLVHEGAAPVLARPAFLYKEGLTAAERGTALHAALQFADLAAAANDLPGEVARLVEGGWLDAALAGQLELPRMAAFLQSPLAARMREAKKLLREYDFITAVPAKFVDDTLPEPFAHQPVLVQGIADAVLVNGDTAEIADYKTDRGKTPEQLLQAYAKQLLLYRAAVEKRLGVRVERCTIYSFSLGREIPVPLEAARGE